MHLTSRPITWTRVLQKTVTGLVIAGLVVLGAGCDAAGTSEEEDGDGDGDGDGTTAPAAPTGLAASSSDGAVELEWSSVDGADTYNVYRAASATDSASGSALDTGISSTSYQDPSVENGERYYYRVTAVDADGNEGDGSEEVEAIPFAPPSGLEGNSGNSQVELSWSAGAGADAYNVYRDTSSMDGVDGDPLMTDVSGTAYTDTTAENGTKYYYRVTSLNAADAESSASNEVGKTPFSDPPDRP